MYCDTQTGVSPQHHRKSHPQTPNRQSSGELTFSISWSSIPLRSSSPGSEPTSETRPNTVLTPEPEVEPEASVCSSSYPQRCQRSGGGQRSRGLLTSPRQHQEEQSGERTPPPLLLAPPLVDRPQTLCLRPCPPASSDTGSPGSAGAPPPLAPPPQTQKSVEPPGHLGLKTTTTGWM